jgi:ADP-dependent NAD(P)H-hydrate dehydratase
MERIAVLPSLPARPADGHKGTFGRVLIVAGSRGMTGAAVLSGLGALRGGAGLVYVATPESTLPIVAASEPSYLTIPLKEDGKGRARKSALKRIQHAAEGMTSLAIGPGWGRSRGLSQLAIALYRDIPQPMVVDADALNALASSPTTLSAHAGPRVLTPHPGEFARLTGAPIEEIASHREAVAEQFASAHDVVLVLKGPGTIVCDGQRIFVNNTGNSGMATGGSGDVLTGLIAALLAQGMPPFEAAQLGVWLHGRAGDLAAAELSQPALIASDLPRYLGLAWKEIGVKQDSEVGSPPLRG